MPIHLQLFKSFGGEKPIFCWADFLFQCRWMGLGCFPFIALAAVLVASSLVIDCVIELQKYNAQDLSGALIALGLLRELGPLVVGLGWAAHVAAAVCSQALLAKENYFTNSFIGFVLCRCAAAFIVSIPLAIYGLTIGFITGGLVAPLLGKTSSADFFESARMAVHYKDVFIYFFKLSVINSVIGVLAGCYCGARPKADPAFAAARAVTMTFILGYVANLIITYFAYRL